MCLYVSCLELFQENMNPLTDLLGILCMPFRKNITIDSVYNTDSGSDFVACCRNSTEKSITVPVNL